MNHLTGSERRLFLRSYRNRSSGAIHSGSLQLFNPNFNGVGGEACGLTWQGVKKRRLDIPDIAFLDTRILFNIFRYSRFDDLHVYSSSALKAAQPTRSHLRTLSAAGSSIVLDCRKLHTDKNQGHQ